MGQNIGKTIRQIRECKELKQEYIAKNLDITQQGYSKIEKGSAPISPYIEKIAELLNFEDEEELQKFIQFIGNRCIIDAFKTYLKNNGQI